MKLIGRRLKRITKPRKEYNEADKKKIEKN